MHARKLSSANGVELFDLLAAPGEAPLRASLMKRVCDIAGALVLLILTAPILVILAILVRRDGGPALYAHRRIGAGGRPFPCLKFRTMRVDANEMLERLLAENPEVRAEWQASFKLRDDPRVTPLGRMLRRTSLDELPQLFNVLAGQMSLVGPRPIIRAEIGRYADKFELYTQCRPGLTGLWQVSGRSDVDYDTRVAFDVEYVSRWSLLLDVGIILRTPLAMLTSRGAY